MDSQEFAGIPRHRPRVRRIGAEIDRLWEKLSVARKTVQCGWLKDKFGMWWQVVPTVLGQMIGDPDPRRLSAFFRP